MKDRYDHEILVIAGALHGEVTGASAGCCDWPPEEYADWLERRLLNWNASPGFTVDYDAAVRLVASVALREWRDYCEELDEDQEQMNPLGLLNGDE